MSFEDLRTEGGHRVSAKRENNATTWLTLTAGRDGPLRIRDNFEGRTPTWSRPEVEMVGDDFLIDLRRGETITATFDRPADGSHPPANVAWPIVVPGRWAIRRNALPVRFGADSEGGSRFVGTIRRLSIFHTPLTDEAVAALASAEELTDHLPGLIVSYRADAAGLRVVRGDGELQAEAVGEVEYSPAGAALDGSAFFEVTDSRDLDLSSGFSVEAWVKPSRPVGRIVDKCRAGSANGITFDLHPEGALRLITGDPHLSARDVVPRGEWVHVAAVADGTTGRQVLYVDGRRVAARTP